ncbi:glutamyl-tRNA(Gln) amidotransferase subunit C, mitochondrial [Ostrinia nubilalis]|uniref:glutamyl-tRNA(Gln) amidotransferase subunit C, mitochondrial n=1 Tax=Ostrinia nubilalis TaxID=29057 RepID=UPI00308263FB
MINSYRFRVNSIVIRIVRNSNSKIPASPEKTYEVNQDQKVVVDKQTISLLERLSLVKCDTVEGVKVLEDSIAFANKILHINTDHVQPLYSVLEKENLYLRPDLVTQGNCQKDILKNASLKEDDYFVAPPGNIPWHELEKEEIEPKVSGKNEN